MVVSIFFIIGSQNFAMHSHLTITITNIENGNGQDNEAILHFTLITGDSGWLRYEPQLFYLPTINTGRGL